MCLLGQHRTTNGTFTLKTRIYKSLTKTGWAVKSLTTNSFNWSTSLVESYRWIAQIALTLSNLLILLTSAETIQQFYGYKKSSLLQLSVESRKPTHQCMTLKKTVGDAYLRECMWLEHTFQLVWSRIWSTQCVGCRIKEQLTVLNE